MKTQQQLVLNSSEEFLSLLINKTFFAVIIDRTEKIAKGAWPKLDTGRAFVYPPGEIYEFEQLVIYDSLRQPVDTADQFIFRNTKMYKIDHGGIMSTGKSFWLEQDTFFMRLIDTFYFDIGNNAVLRQLNDRFFVMNIRGDLIGERTNWWQLYIIEKKADNVFSTWECSRRTKGLPSLIYLYQDHTFYFNVAWTAVEILQLMKDGYFVETNEYQLKQ